MSNMRRLVAFYFYLFLLIGHLPFYYSFKRHTVVSNGFLSLWFFFINLIKFLFALKYALTETLRFSGVASKDLVLFLLMAFQNILFRLFFLFFIFEVISNRHELRKLARQINLLVLTKGHTSECLEKSLIVKTILDVFLSVALMIFITDAYPGDVQMFWLTVIDLLFFFLIIDLYYVAYGIKSSLVQQVLLVKDIRKSNLTEVARYLFKLLEIKERISKVFQKSFLLIYGYNLLAFIGFVSVPRSFVSRLYSNLVLIVYNHLCEDHWTRGQLQHCSLGKQSNGLPTLVTHFIAIVVLVFRTK